MKSPRDLDKRLASLIGAPTQMVAQLPSRLRDELPAIPDHELIRCIGRGAYGEVWLARTVLGTFRAVKIVFRDSFSSDEPYEREFRGIQRFEPVSRSNDGLVDILQAGRHDARGSFYYVMELADDARTPGAAGRPAAHIEDPDAYVPETLATRRRSRNRIPISECLPLGLSLTSALGHLHRHGLIHRDIKPSNIIFVQGVAKLADIGLVVEVEEALSFVGTEGFIPPEGPTSAQADLYSLGKVLYEASMGKDRKEYPEPMTGLMEATDRDEREALLELNTIILKACAESISERYQTAEEMHADLALVHSGRSVRWKRLVEKRLAMARKAAAVVAVIATLATGAWLYQRHQTSEARRLRAVAQTQTQEARRQQRIAEEAMARMQIQKAEGQLQSGDSPLGLAWLAHVLRRHPDNRVAAERIMAALTYRHFPRPAIAPLVHTDMVLTAHFSPDGQTIASAAGDRHVCLWDARTGAEKWASLRHSGTVNSVIFSPDGRQVLTASADGTACVLDAQTGALVCPTLQHGAPVHAAVFSPNGEWIATGGADAKVRRFSARTGEPVAQPVDVAGAVNALTCSPDSRHLAAATADRRTARGRIPMWNVESGERKHDFAVQGPARFVIFSPNGRWLAAAALNNQTALDSSTDWEVYVWDVDSGQLVAGPLIHDHVKSLAFSPDSRRLVTGDIDNVATVWEVATGEPVSRLSHSAPVTSAVFSADGRDVLTASTNHKARLWDAASGQPVSEPMLHGARIDHAELSRDGERILTVGRRDVTVKIWSARPNRPAKRTLPHERWVGSATLDANGAKAITATSAAVSIASGGTAREENYQQSITVWGSAAGTPQTSPALTTPEEAVTAQFTQAGPMALIAKRKSDQGFHGIVRILDLTKGMAIGEEINLAADITCADFSADGLKVAVASSDGRVLIRDARTGGALKPPLTNCGRVKSVQFSPDGRLLVAGSLDGMALVWDSETGQRVAPPLEHEDGVWFAGFSPAGDRVVTTSHDFTAGIWSLSGERLATLHHSADVEHADFSPDGSKVVTASGDRTARLWSVATGRQLTEEPLEHEHFVLTARFSSDGLRVITASRDGTAQLWDAETGLKLSDPLRHAGGVVSAGFSGDGRRAITASLDRTAAIWEVPVAPQPIPTWLPELAEAIGGQRLNADRLPETVSWKELVELQGRLDNLPTTDPYISWVRKHVTEPKERTGP